MSNQRPAKTYRGAASDNSIQGMMMKTFFREAAILLEREGHLEPAFYFEQMADYLSDGNSLPTERKMVSRALGL